MQQRWQVHVQVLQVHQMWSERVLSHQLREYITEQVLLLKVLVVDEVIAGLNTRRISLRVIVLECTERNHKGPKRQLVRSKILAGLSGICLSQQTPSKPRRFRHSARACGLCLDVLGI